MIFMSEITYLTISVLQFQLMYCYKVYKLKNEHNQTTS